MSTRTKASRTQLWMENLGEWSWPGRGSEAAESLPPSWVPVFPPRLEPVTAAAAGVPARSSRALPRTLGTGALLSALAALCVSVALNGPLPLEHLLGLHASTPIAETSGARATATALPPPPLIPVGGASAAGSSIDKASYSSSALHGAGSFLVYLPPGYATTNLHYPVLYLLHGNDQPADAFLQIGLQGTLDRLIARHETPPLIAVMIQGGRGANNWRAQGSRNYESYILEVQEIIDRALPTVADRGARAVLGDSMGGYGAMNVVLDHPQRFSVVESWLGFFNGLGGQLRADRPLIAGLGLHAFIYGGESDEIAHPSENAPFAAALRAAGASAHSAVYPGGHSMETLQAHLSSMLLYAGRELQGDAPAASSASVRG
jgi:enterochelin esterase-like enzyme